MGVGVRHRSGVRERIQRTAAASAKRIYEAVEWVNRTASLVELRPFYSSADFPWALALERDWLAMREALQHVLASHAVPNFQDALPGQHHLTTGDDWKSFFLLLLGARVDANCAVCPRTTELLQQIPGVETAFFSILKPGKHIPPHRGPYNGLLRYHLALIVPEPRERCRIRVDEQWAHWEEGKSLIFDDTLTHEVFNDTTERRVVLFVDFRRPLRFPISLLNRLALRALGRLRLVQRRRDGLGAVTAAAFAPGRQMDY